MRRPRHTPRGRPPRQASRRALTLVEMVVSVAVVSVLALSMGSAILIASRALPDADNPAGRSLDAAAVADQMAGELYSAVSVIYSSATAIEFAVERGGANRTIRYEWSGAPGDPLTRQYDGGANVVAIDRVHQFELTYATEEIAEAPPAAVEGEEVELSSHTAAGEASTFSIARNDWIGQYFSPADLPADAISWAVTRVLFEAQVRGKATGATRVQLRRATVSKLPAQGVLEEHTMPESDLGAGYAWREFQFSSVSGLGPAEALCLVLQWVSDTHSANVRYDDGGGAGLLITGDGGASWSYDAGRSLSHYVYGKVTTPDPNPPPAKARLLLTGITLATTVQPSPAVRTEVLLLNQPEVSGG